MASTYGIWYLFFLLIRRCAYIMAVVRKYGAATHMGRSLLLHRILLRNCVYARKRQWIQQQQPSPCARSSKGPALNCADAYTKKHWRHRCEPVNKTSPITRDLDTPRHFQQQDRRRCEFGKDPSWRIQTLEDIHRLKFNIGRPHAVMMRRSREEGTRS